MTSKYQLPFRPLPKLKSDLRPLNENPNPEVDFSNIKIPRHLSKKLLSYFPKASSKKCLILDLGCGKAIHKQVANRAGYRYVSLDYNSPKAQIRGDAHALPFKKNSFDFILSIAVLEHIRYPYIMIEEVNRVLKPRGKFIGTVAFLEPFHGNSYFHFTHLGLTSLLQHGGFDIEKIAPSETWSVLAAQTSALFPNMPKTLAKTLIFPLESIHRLWWSLGALVTGNRERKKTNRVLATTGAFAFIAHKPN